LVPTCRALAPYRWWDGQQWTASFTGNVSVGGTDSDGVITLVAAFLRAGLTLWGFAGGPSCPPLIAAAVVAALVGLVAAIDLADVAGRIAHADAGDAPFSASMGIGLWLVLLRAIARVAVCDLKLASWRKQMVRCGSIRQAMRSGADSPRPAQPARSGRFALLLCPARTTRHRRSGAAFNLNPSCAGVAFRAVVAGEDQHRTEQPGDLGCCTLRAGKVGDRAEPFVIRR
jgi:hypothetical protein